MHLFITGGTGFIGRHLCQLLRNHNHTLTVLSRQSDEKVQELLGEVGILHSLGDLSPTHRFDAVINLAGEPIIGPPWTKRRKQQLWDSRVTLTQRLVTWMERAERPPAVLISGSAVGFYGDQGEAIVTEETPAVENGFGQKLCAAWEKAAVEAEKYGVRVCRIRTGPVLGKGGGLLARMLPSFRLGLGGRLGSGAQWFPWVHLEDHLQMTRHLLDSPGLSGPFNLTAPHPVTNAQFTDALARMLERPALLPIPAMLLKLLMGDLAEILLASQRVVPARFQEMGFPFRYGHLEEALKQILRP